MCKVYSVTSQKGGTAKTTTVFNFGAYLAGKGYRVLLIDTDPQGSLTASLGFGNPDEMDVTIANVMEKEITTMEVIKSLLIKDTTREEREQIVAESIGNVNGSCDGLFRGF